LYFLKFAFSFGQGYLNNLTNPKSSAVACTFIFGCQSTALMSDPSAQGGQIPYWCQPNLAVFVNQISSLLSDAPEPMFFELLILKNRISYA